jgi:type II secretory pathway pseudopilin PulG
MDGFTLVEVMLAAMVFIVAGLGVFTIMIKAYQVVTLARYHDDARAVLQTFANQFLRLQTSDLGSSGSGVYSRLMFSPVGSATGGGLLWDKTSAPSEANLTLNSLSNEKGGPTATAFNGETLTVTIGGSQNGIPAQVTRFVQQLKNDGTPSSTAVAPEPAGQLLIGTFTIKYKIPTINSGQDIVQSITVLRASP